MSLTLTPERAQGIAQAAIHLDGIKKQLAEAERLGQTKDARAHRDAVSDAERALDGLIGEVRK